MTDLSRVQSVFSDEPSPNPTVSYVSTPIVGNLLVATMGHRNGDATSEPTVDGFQLRAVAHTVSDGGNKGSAIFERIADGTETEADATAGDWQSIQVAEYATGGGIVEFLGGNTGHSGASSVGTFTVDVEPAIGSVSLAVASAFHRANAVDDDSPAAYDSGFDTNIAHFKGGEAYGESQLAISYRNDADSVPGNDVTWTNVNAREVALSTCTWQLGLVWDISGQVTKDGAAVEGASVVVLHEHSGTTFFREKTVTDASGNWSSDVPEGSTAHAMAWWDDAGTLHTAEGRPFIEEPGP